jgi:predicted nucleic acid-binding protein
MKFVLDASVAIKWVVPEADAARALLPRDAFRKGLHEFLAPETFAVEVAHALTRAERRGILQTPLSVQPFRNVMSNGPVLHSFLPLLMRATELSSQERIGVYDCLYLALAEREQCDVLTADKRLKAIGHPQVVLLAGLP